METMNNLLCDEISEHTLESSQESNKLAKDNELNRSTTSSDVSEASSSTSVSSGGRTTHEIVRETMRDVISFQQGAMEQLRATANKQKSAYVTKASYEEAIRKYENERLGHEKTKLLLTKESEKLQFALGEIEILTKHLEREKKAHEDLLKSIREKALRESKRGDLLYNKCAKIEETIERQNDDLSMKENEITALKQRLQNQKEIHEQTLNDMKIQRAQEQYMSRSLNEKRSKRRI